MEEEREKEGEGEGGMKGVLHSEGGREGGTHASSMMLDG